MTGGIGAPFATFGLADIVPGFVSLDFIGTEQGANAKARVAIPLGTGK